MNPECEQQKPEQGLTAEQEASNPEQNQGLDQNVDQTRESVASRTQALFEGDSSPSSPPPPPPAQTSSAQNKEPEPSQQAPGTSEDDEDVDAPMPLLEHLGELRRRMTRSLCAILIGFFACYSVAEPLFNELLRPLEAAMPANAHMVYLSLPEVFFLHMKIALLASLFVVSPYLFYQLWAFIAPGLYAHERKYVVPIACISAIFFALGAAFCYFVVLPFAFTFFLSYSNELVVAMPDVGVYFSFVLKLLLAFGLIFEMPLFALFLARMGLVTAAAMRRTRKYAVLGIFIVAAILTPPDVMSQTLMAVPMLVLYEISIVVAAMFGRKTKAAPAMDADKAPEDLDGEKV